MKLNITVQPSSNQAWWLAFYIAALGGYAVTDQIAFIWAFNVPITITTILWVLGFFLIRRPVVETGAPAAAVTEHQLKSLVIAAAFVFGLTSLGLYKTAALYVVCFALGKLVSAHLIKVASPEAGEAK